MDSGGRDTATVSSVFQAIALAMAIVGIMYVSSKYLLDWLHALML